MHIVYVVGPGGGAETVLRALHPALEDLGHKVSVVYSAPAGVGLAQFPPRVQVLYALRGSAHYYLHRMVGNFRAWPLRLRAWEEAWAVLQAVRQIDSEEPVDLVEVAEGFPIPLLLRRWTVVIRTHGSDWTFRYFCRDRQSVDDRWLVRAEAKQLRQAHAVSAPSRHMADHLSAVCGLPEDRFDVIPNPADVSRFCPRRQEDPPPEPTLLSVGRLEHRKGMDLLLSAMHRVWKRFPQTRVCLIGSEAGLSHEHLQAMAPREKWGLVDLPGVLPHDQLPGRYRRATLYVTATEFEVLPLNVMEAMASGLPVVATRVGGLPELVEDGKTGFLVPPGDIVALSAAIERLLEDEVLRGDMGRRGRERVLTEFAAERIAPRMVRLYEHAIFKKRRERAPGGRPACCTQPTGGNTR